MSYIILDEDVLYIDRLKYDYFTKIRGIQRQGLIGDDLFFY